MQKKKPTIEQKRKMINIALGAFGISIVIFAVIGAIVIDNFSNLQPIEDLSAMDEDTYKGEIDDRLRFIAMQDGNGEKAITSDENTSEENESSNQEPEEIAAFLENNDAPKNKFEEYNEKHKKTTDNTSNSLKVDNFYEQDSEIPYRKEVPYSANPSLKVVIGSYASKAEAQAALEKMSSQFTAPPFIKSLNGRYTLQVGSFKTPQTAQEFTNSLKQQGYSARIIEE